MRHAKSLFVCFAAGFSILLMAMAAASNDTPAPGDRKKLPGHVHQADIDSGVLNLADLMDAGKFLFSTNFNVLDGFGRPGSTGNGAPSSRAPGSAPFMIRTSGPEANSCAGCHNQPEIGGAGDFVANVFVLAQVRDPVTDSIHPDFSNERNTLGMHGSGAIEMLAREMTADLQSIRSETIAKAKSTGVDQTAELKTKDVRFGSITAHPDGSVDTSKIEGVDADLVIKPFHQKGVVNSVRVFTVNAFNHHHGLQAAERFGVLRTGFADFDMDGVQDELSTGDITATTLYQVGLQIPGRLLPRDLEARARIEAGEHLFASIGCADCHRPALVLNHPVFTEPNPYNPAGNLRVQDVPQPFAFDLTKDSLAPRLERLANGKAVVRAFTDLKRHKIADDADPFFANEKLIQGGVPTDVFLTRKLWDCGNTSPYGHRGDCTTISEAILHHAGEARQSRDAFAALSEGQKTNVVDFLKSLQILPAGSPRVMIADEHIPRAFR